MKKKHILLLFLILVFTIGIAIPVFALNGDSNYHQNLSGNTYYISIGNIGNVEPDSDVIVPIYVNSIGNVISKINMLSFNVIYDSDYFEYVDGYWADQIPQDWSEDDIEALNGLIGTNELMQASGCMHILSPIDNGFSGSILCSGYSNNPNDGMSSQAFFANGPVAFIVLHTSNDFSGKHELKFANSMHNNVVSNNFGYVPFFQTTFNTNYNWQRKEPFVNFDGVISSSNVSSKVTFVDWNGTILDTQFIGSGNTPSDIIHPHRIGYNFEAWDKDLDTVSNALSLGGYDIYFDSLVGATYTIKTYTVGFEFINEDEGWDEEPITQTVEHGKAAIPPEFPNGYECDLDVDDYIFIDSNRTIISECSAISEPESGS